MAEETFDSVESIELATGLLGGPTKLAQLLGVSSQALGFWRKGKYPIPPEHCLIIENLTGGLITCEHLRPDVQWWVLRRGEKRGKAK